MSIYKINKKYPKQLLDEYIIFQEKESGMILIREDGCDHSRDTMIEIPMLVGILETLEYEVYFFNKKEFEEKGLPIYLQNRKDINKDTYNILTYDEYILLLSKEIKKLREKE